VIFVDTSVWVRALRRADSRQAHHLGMLLDADQVALAAPVGVEILSGASRPDRPRLRRALSALPVFYPSAATWERIDAWIDVAGDVGERFGVVDLLIGAIARDQNGALWSLDADFDRMARLGFLELHRAGA
jgi:predicted nucleic acid-binding protein